MMGPGPDRTRRSSRARAASFALPAAFSALPLALALALAPARVDALAIAIRAPLDLANPGLVDFDSVDGGLAQVNPLGVLLVLEPGYAVTTTAFADDTTGQIGGRAGFGLVTDRPGPLAAAFAEGNVTGDATVPGAPGTFTFMVVTLDLHGRFVGLDGTPQAGMRGTLSVSGVPDAAPTYQVTSAIDWEMPEGLPAVQTTTWAFMGNDPAAAYPAAQPNVVSSHPDTLRGQARISFLAEGGTQIFVEADLQGEARPLFSLGNSIKGDGQIDFVNTGILRVELPAGTSLVNPTGVLASSVVVPEPASASSLAAGCAFVAALAGRRRRAARRDLERRAPDGERRSGSTRETECCASV